jgi:plasmid stability protein
VQELNLRAATHGISSEEEHRRILGEILLKPLDVKPSLIYYLISQESEVEPGIDFDLTRSREVESRFIEI